LWIAQLSPDRRLLAQEFIDHHFESPTDVSVILVATDTGGKLAGWKSSPFLDPKFAPDGRSLLSFNRSPFGFEVREVATGAVRVREFYWRTASACQFSPDGRTLAVAIGPGPIELWDLIGDRTKPERWDAQKADATWEALAGRDASRAFAAIRYLRANPAEAVSLLKRRVKVPDAPTAEWVANRIKGLDAPLYRDREKATADLAAAGEVVEEALLVALKAASAEARKRLEGLLQKADEMTPEKLRVIRACEVLEGIGSIEARELLATWAKGPPGAALTREAAESLERLKRR
jgi:hypothetical protein